MANGGLSQAQQDQLEKAVNYCLRKIAPDREYEVELIVGYTAKSFSIRIIEEY